MRSSLNSRKNGMEASLFRRKSEEGKSHWDGHSWRTIWLHGMHEHLPTTTIGTTTSINSIQHHIYTALPRSFMMKTTNDAMTGTERGFYGQNMGSRPRHTTHTRTQSAKKLLTPWDDDGYSPGSLNARTTKSINERLTEENAICMEWEFWTVKGVVVLIFVFLSVLYRSRMILLISSISICISVPRQWASDAGTLELELQLQPG